MSTSAAPAAAGRPLLMIPGPIEFHPDVLAKLGENTSGKNRHRAWHEGGKEREKTLTVC